MSRSGITLRDISWSDATHRYRLDSCNTHLVLLTRNTSLLNLFSIQTLNTKIKECASRKMPTSYFFLSNQCDSQTSFCIETCYFKMIHLHDKRWTSCHHLHDERCTGKRCTRDAQEMHKRCTANWSMPMLSLPSFPTLVIPVLSAKNRLRILCVAPQLHSLPLSPNITTCK